MTYVGLLRLKLLAEIEIPGVRDSQRRTTECDEEPAETTVPAAIRVDGLEW